MKYLFSLLLLISCVQGFAQESEEISVEMLQAPSSPAANLLGISDADIQRPSDKNELVGMIRQSSDNFSALPTSFALDYAPIRKDLNDFMNYNTKENRAYSNLNLGANLRQSLVFSAAMQSLDSAKDDVLVSSQQFGFGLKISLARGQLDGAFAQKIQQIRDLKRALLPAMDSLIEARKKEADLVLRDSIRQEMRKPASERDMPKITAWNHQRAQLDSAISTAVKTEYAANEASFKSIKTMVEGLSYDRFGFKWDLAAGMVLDFPNSSFDDGTITKAGIWTVFGYETRESGLSMLGLIRYMYNPDKIYADDNKTNVLQSNVSTIDVGARFIVGNFNKLSASAEAIYRSATVSEIESSWRLTMNTSYDVAKDQKLTFIFGRDFDGTISKDGSLIAALAYVRGFGSKLE